MKISEMNKKELLEFMQGNGEWHRYKSDLPSWQRAFLLARQNGLENLDHGCAKCVLKVKEWMERA